MTYDDGDDDEPTENNSSYPEDVLSQRAYALASVGHLAITARSSSDAEVRLLCIEMMRKINASLPMPPDEKSRVADIRVIK